jgi:E3 ubiquitin ligase
MGSGAAGPVARYRSRPMVIGGIIALIVAAVAYVYAHTQQKSLNAMLLSETLTCGELGELSRAASDAVGAGSFSQACEVVGTAAPGPQGPLKAPDSGREVVWHHTLLTEHYTETRRDSDGREQTEQKTRTVAQHFSQEPFVVKDATGEIVVDPRGANVDEAVKLVDRFDSGIGPIEIGDSALANLAEGFARHGSSGGVQHQEWGIPIGQRLYVLAEATDRNGGLAMARPEKGRFMISTQSEEELRKSATTGVTIATVIAVVAGLAGVVLVVLGLI